MAAFIKISTYDYCVRYFCIMADVHSKEIRSYNMSRIKSRNTKAEMLVRRFLYANRFRYKPHNKAVPGNLIHLNESP
ncbi:MAG: hypothetical protein ABIN97_04825 [Ginsengibacter sp.]